MIYLEIAIVAALIVINGLLAMAELAVVSSRRSRLQALVDREVLGSRRALALASDPGKFLSTVQIGITLVGVLSGAFSGATLGLRLAEFFMSLGMPSRVAETVGVGLVVAAITYASLIVGELVPKQIALRSPERIAVKVAPAMTVLASLCSPLVGLLDFSGRLVLRALGYQAQPEHHVTDEEIRTLIAEAETAGVIEPSEREMITGVMRLGDRPVRAIMTPRREVDMIDLSDSPVEVRRAIVESAHSRLPVHEGAPDAILGVVQAKDLIDACLRGDMDVRAQIRPAPTVLDTADALDVLDIIKESTVHIALVHDEYGHFEGVVTNADILEAIVGEFRTNEEPREPDAVQRGDGSWLISGSMPVDEMADRLSISLPRERGFHTAAGFALDRIGYLPKVGETFDGEGWRFEIIDLDGRRIDRILATRIAGRRRRAAV
jgi:magnesium and cobalt exporter, CNNM family